ncbi:WD40 repeat domain-containing protein [Mesorhizobium sp. 128a]
MNRDRALALLLLAIGVVCFAMQRLAQGDASIAASFASIRPVALFVAGAACVVGAILFFAGALPAPPNHLSGTPLFGRVAEVQNPGRPKLRRTFLVLPAIVVLALLADRFGPWRGAGPGGEVAAPKEPAEPKSNEPKDIAGAPATPPAAPTPPAQAAPPPVQATNPPEPPVQPPSAPEPPPEVALAPATPPPEAAPPPAPASPPQAALPSPPETVAPLPPAELPLPTEPDGHRDAVVWLAVSADGRDIMSASTDHMIKLWDIAASG